MPDLGAAAGHKIEHACRVARLVDQLGKDIRRERRVLAGLENDAAAGQQCGNDLLFDLLKREVPRRKPRHNADRLTTDDGGAAALFVAKASGGLDIVFCFQNERVCVHFGGDLYRAAELSADGVDQALTVAAHPGEYPFHLLQPLGKRCELPRFESGLCGGDSFVHVRVARARNARDDRMGLGVFHLDYAVAFGHNP